METALVVTWYLPVTVLVLRDPLARAVLGEMGWHAARYVASEAVRAAAALGRWLVASMGTARRRTRALTHS